MSERKSMTKLVEKKGYGYEKDNPIQVFQMLGCRDFFASLRNPKYPILNIIRVGNVGENKNKHIVDQYAIYCLNTDKKANKYKFYKYLFYVDMYTACYNGDAQAPEDFITIN